MTDSSESAEYRNRVLANGRRAGKSTRLRYAYGETGVTDEVLGVLTGQVPIQVNHPACPDHVEVQHRDAKPPWCNRCGWTHGQVAKATPARPLGSPRE